MNKIVTNVKTYLRDFDLCGTSKAALWLNVRALYLCVGKIHVNVSDVNAD